MIDKMLKSRLATLFGTVGVVLIQLLNIGFSQASSQSYKTWDCTYISAIKSHAQNEFTDQAIANSALEWTRTSFIVLGLPKIILIRSVTVEDLSRLGLPEGAGVNPGRPLKLVVVKGNFDLSNMRGGFSSKKEKATASYVAYLFDLEAGFPITTLTSKHGGRFRKVLNQPNLPDDFQPNDLGIYKKNFPEAVPVTIPVL